MLSSATVCRSELRYIFTSLTRSPRSAFIKSARCLAARWLWFVGHFAISSLFGMSIALLFTLMSSTKFPCTVVNLSDTTPVAGVLAYLSSEIRRVRDLLINPNIDGHWR